MELIKRIVTGLTWIKWVLGMINYDSVSNNIKLCDKLFGGTWPSTRTQWNQLKADEIAML